MVMKGNPRPKVRACAFEKPDGRSCGAAPLKGKRFCFWHAPDRSEEVKRAQKLGGIRRRREKTVALAYAIDGMREPEQVRRVLEIALVDTLSLENSVPRNRDRKSVV